MIKTFRGLLADGGQNRIRLSTIKGKVGYRIAKFQVISNTPGASADESTVTIWKNEQATVSTSANDVNFTDSDMLGVGYWAGASGSGSPFDMAVIFDNEIFNQDIYITHTNVAAGTATPCNYYLELEVIPLDDAGAEYTTLKDMRTS